MQGESNGSFAPCVESAGTSSQAQAIAKGSFHQRGEGMPRCGGSPGATYPRSTIRRSSNRDRQPHRSTRTKTPRKCRCDAECRWSETEECGGQRLGHSSYEKIQNIKIFCPEKTDDIRGVECIEIYVRGKLRSYCMFDEMYLTSDIARVRSSQWLLCYLCSTLTLSQWLTRNQRQSASSARALAIVVRLC